MKRKIIYVLSVLTITLGCNSADYELSVAPAKNDLVQLEVNEISPGFYGYSIRQNGKLLIQQKHIPATQELRLFVNPADAQAVGMLVKKKVEQKIFPPTISEGELDSLGISF